MDNLMTVLEAADVLRVNKQTVYRLVWAKELDRVDIGTGKKPRFRIPGSSVQRFITSRQRGGKAA